MLLILENIKNNADLDPKTSHPNKPKGAEGKRKMESIDSRLPKKPKKVGWTDKLSSARSMGARSRVTTRVTAVASTRTVLRSKIVGARIGPSPIKRDKTGLLLHN